MTEVDQERLYEEYWLKIENLVGYDSLTTFFLDFLNIKVEGFPKEDEAYEVFKKVFEVGYYTNESILQEILHYAGLYHAFTKGDNRYSQEVNNYLSGLYKLNQTTVYLFLYKVFDDFHNQVIDQNMLEKVLRFLLNYSIRRIVCEIPSNSLRGLYKTLYNRVIIRSENKMNYCDAVVSFFQRLTSKDALVTEELFANDLKFNNLI